MSRIVKKFVRWLNPELPLPEVRDYGDGAEKLRTVVSSMAGPLEEVFGLSKDPNQCLPVSLVVAQYLREKDYDASVMPALYLKTHPVVSERYGKSVARGSSLRAVCLSLNPLYRRHPRRFTDNLEGGREGGGDGRNMFLLAEDCFTLVRLGKQGGGKDYFMVHGTYRQYLPAGEREKFPQIAFDRIDTKTLRGKYHLALVSPECVSEQLEVERLIFSDTPDPALMKEYGSLRKLIRGKYAEFKSKMDALGGGSVSPPVLHA